MKKIVTFILILCMVLSFAACGSNENSENSSNAEITMQEIYDASNLTSALEGHESIHAKYMSDGVPYEEDYLTKDYIYSLYKGSYFGLESDFAFFTTDHAFYSCEEGKYTRSFLLTPEGLTDTYRSEDDVVMVLSADAVKETIQDVTKNDNRIAVTSFLDKEAMKELGMDSMISSDGEYVLDEKTRELISTKIVADYGEGMRYEVATEIFYDAEAPEGLKAFLDYDSQTEDLRTITIVSNPGTEKEKSESVQVAKGLSVSLEPAEYDEETFAMYADAACTQPLDPSEDDNSDLTIYVK